TTTCAVPSAIAHLSPSTDSLEPDRSFPSPLFRVQSLVYRRLWIVSSPTTRSHPLCCFEHNRSSIAGYGLSRARLLFPFSSAVLSATARPAVYGLSRAWPLIPVPAVSSTTACLAPSMDCLETDRSFPSLLF
ncbi:hypothetical protein EV363DRAFT_1167160, partial [Boletus edulis]